FSASPWLKPILNDADQIRHRAFNYLSSFFSTITQTSSAVATMMMLEDVHWSDEGSLEFLEHLAHHCQDVPLMIVCSTRPNLYERHPGWGRNLGSHTRMDLEALSRRESRQLVESILSKTDEIPQALRELIVGGAEGIPFYIEEIIKMLMDQKV